MRAIGFLLLTFLPALLNAQFKYAFSSPLPNESRSLRCGDKTILVHQLDQFNQAHKWITFDTGLAAVSVKKLITPDANNIVSQQYLEGDNRIIRIDQVVLGNQLEVNAFVFDVRGYLLRSQRLDNISMAGKKMQLKPFTAIQSPDNKVVALTHVSVKDDVASVAAIVMNDELDVRTHNSFTLPYDEKLLDLYRPVVSNNADLFLPVVDKFKSYKLSGFMHGYLLKAGAQAPSTIEFDFVRQKAKNLTFQFAGERLIFSALFSRDKSKANVAGVLFGGYDLEDKQKIATNQYVFDNKTKADLKKLFGSEGRKGSLLNYLSLVPETFFNDANDAYATLAQDQQSPRYVPRSSPAPLPTLDELRMEQAYINALVRRTLPGASRPLNAAEAATYAALNPRQNVRTDNLSDYRPMDAASRQITQRAYDKNLLFFNFQKTSAPSHKFLKLKSPDVPGYQFFTYIPANNGYGALHYVVPNFTRPYLKSTVIDGKGNVVNKKVYEDKVKIIAADYPWLINNNSLIAFYEDRITGQMGLVKVAL